MDHLREAKRRGLNVLPECYALGRALESASVLLVATEAIYDNVPEEVEKYLCQGDVRCMWCDGWSYWASADPCGPMPANYTNLPPHRIIGLARLEGVGAQVNECWHCHGRGHTLEL